MKILLCIPVMKGSYQASPDLGLGYLATALLKKGHEVRIIDSVNLDLSYEGFRKVVEDEKPQVVGIKVFSRDIISTRECLKMVKEADEGITTIIGGPHPSTAPPGESMEYFGQADYAFRGEADFGLPMLLDKVAKRETGFDDLKEIPGLIFRHDGKVTANTQQFIQDLDSLGIAAWDLMDPRIYAKKEAFSFYVDKSPVAPIIATRGCPFECSFCSSHLTTGRKVRYRSVRSVVDEIKLLKNKFGVKVINIVDDNIALSKKYILDFCDTLINEGVNLEWHCAYGVRLDSLDPEIIKKMEQSGCRSMTVGIESGNADVLKHMKRKVTLDVMESKVRMIKENSNIMVQGNFIVGYATETRETVLQTIKFAKRLRVDIAAFSPFRPTPGTPVFSEMVEKGVIDKALWDGFTVDDVVFSPPGLSHEELERLWKRAYLEFYSQPRIIWGLLKKVRSAQQLRWITRGLFNKLFKLNRPGS